MDWDRLITIEQMEAATNELLETGKKVGADSWQQRVKNQTPHCGFGEAGTCCRICSMGPCRITPKAPRGICGCDVHGIVGRNYLRFTAGGAATHSDHGRQICHTLYQAKEGGSYQVKDPEKLKKIAAEWGIETEGKDIYDLAHEVAETGLLEYGKPFGVQRYLKRAPEHTQKLWHDAGIEPRAIDREVSQSLHMTHMGCSSLPEALIKQSLRAGLSDGWGGSMMGTEFSDILFGTPRPVDTTANIGVMEKDMVNIIVHGHDPSLSEMIVMYSQDPEMVALAKSVGAKGINIAGVCCTGNEVAMRQGIPMAGNFLQQENVVLTGACEAIVVDVQCIFPALGPLSKCFHTKFITTSPIARMPDSDFIEFHEDTAADNAKAIIKMAVENFKNRKPELVNIPNLKTKARVGYSVEAIKKELDGVCNYFIMNSKVAFMQDRVQGIIDTIAEKCPNSTLAYEPPKIVLAEAVETFSNMLTACPDVQVVCTGYSTCATNIIAEWLPEIQRKGGDLSKYGVFTCDCTNLDLEYMAQTVKGENILRSTVDLGLKELVPMGMITQCEAAIRGLDCEYAEGEVVTFPHDLVDLTNYEETAAKYNVEI